MFLPGLVLNANKLMYELRRKGQEIAVLNGKMRTAEQHSRTAHVLRGQIDSLYREVSTIAEEWSAEVQYVYLVKDMLGRYMGSNHEIASYKGGEDFVPLVVTGLEQLEVQSKLEARADFALLQELAEGSQSWFGFRPDAALADHREFLNEVLSANEIDPFLLRLSGAERDLAAMLLGRAIVATVPDERIDDLRTGAARLSDFPGVADAMRLMREEALDRASKFAPIDRKDVQSEGIVDHA